jgi:hypothetical protein
MASEDFTFLDGLIQGPPGPPGPAGAGVNMPDNPADDGKFAAALTGDLVYLDAATATSRLNTFTSSLKGLVPSSGGGTTNYLRADGSWAAPVSLPVSGGDDYKVAFGLSGNLAFATSVKLGTAGDSLVFGGTATTGAKLNFPGSGTLSRARNAAGTGNVDLLTWGSTADRFWIGDSAALAGLDLLLKTGGDLNVAVNGTPEYGFSSTALTMNGNNLLMGGGFASFGTNPAGAGAIRLANALNVTARNAGNTADIPLIRSDASDNVLVGSTATGGDHYIDAATGKTIWVRFNGGTPDYRFTSTFADFTDNWLQFGTNPASAGVIRLPNATNIYARNFLNTANISLITAGTDNVVYVGDLTNASEVDIQTATNFDIDFNGGMNPEYRFTVTALNMSDNVLVFGTNAAASGLVRVPANIGDIIAAKNYDGTGNQVILNLAGDGTTFQDLRVGDGSAKGNTSFYVQAKAQLVVSLAATNEYVFSSTALAMNANNLTGVGFISTSGTVAGSGLFRVPANSSILVGTDGSSHDLPLVSTDASNNAVFGTATFAGSGGRAIIKGVDGGSGGITLTVTGAGPVTATLVYGWTGISHTGAGGTFGLFSSSAALSSPNNITILTGRNNAGSSDINLMDWGVVAADHLRIGTQVVNMRFASTNLGFYSATPVAKPTVTGSRATDAWRTSLMSALSTLGLLTDSSTA